MEDMPSWEDQKKKMSADFHLDPEKESDPADKLVERYGLEDAIDQLIDKMKEDPDDAETRRQTALLLHRLDVKLQPLRDKMLH